MTLDDAHDGAERLRLLNQRAPRGRREFALCAFVLLPAHVFTLLIFWRIYRGSDVARLFGCALALAMTTVFLLIAYVAKLLGPAESLFFAGVTLLWLWAAYVLASSPHLQAFQELQRKSTVPPRQARRLQHS